MAYTQAQVNDLVKQMSGGGVVAAVNPYAPTPEQIAAYEEAHKPGIIGTMYDGIMGGLKNVVAGAGQGLNSATLGVASVPSDVMFGGDNDPTVVTRAKQAIDTALEDYAGPADSMYLQVARGLGNMGGYMAATPIYAGLMSTLGLGGLASGGVALASKAIPGAAKIASLYKASPAATQMLAKAAGIEGLVEGSETYNENRDAGGSKGTALLRGAGNTAIQAPIGLVSSLIANTAGSKAISNLLTKGIVDEGKRIAAQKGAEVTGRAIANALENSFEEGAQGAGELYFGKDQVPFSELFTGKNLDNISNQAAVGGIVGGILGGGMGKVNNYMTDKRYKSIVAQADIDSKISSLQERPDVDTNPDVKAAMAQLQNQKGRIELANTTGNPGSRNAFMDNAEAKLNDSLTKYNELEPYQPPEKEAPEEIAKDPQAAAKPSAFTATKEDAMNRLNAVRQRISEVESMISERPESEARSLNKYLVALKKAESEYDMAQGARAQENLISKMRQGNDSFQRAEDLYDSFKDFLSEVAPTTKTTEAPAQPTEAATQTAETPVQPAEAAQTQENTEPVPGVDVPFKKANEAEVQRLKAEQDSMAKEVEVLTAKKRKPQKKIDSIYKKIEAIKKKIDTLLSEPEDTTPSQAVKAQPIPATPETPTKTTVAPTSAAATPTQTTTTTTTAKVAPTPATPTQKGNGKAVAGNKTTTGAVKVASPEVGAVVSENPALGDKAIMSQPSAQESQAQAQNAEPAPKTVTYPGKIVMPENPTNDDYVRANKAARAYLKTHLIPSLDATKKAISKSSFPISNDKKGQINALIEQMKTALKDKGDISKAAPLIRNLNTLLSEVTGDPRIAADNARLAEAQRVIDSVTKSPELATDIANAREMFVKKNPEIVVPEGETKTPLAASKVIRDGRLSRYDKMAEAAANGTITPDLTKVFYQDYQRLITDAMEENKAQEATPEGAVIKKSLAEQLSKASNALINLNQDLSPSKQSSALTEGLTALRELLQTIGSDEVMMASTDAGSSGIGVVNTATTGGEAMANDKRKTAKEAKAETDANVERLQAAEDKARAPIRFTENMPMARKEAIIQEKLGELEQATARLTNKMEAIKLGFTDEEINKIFPYDRNTRNQFQAALSYVKEGELTKAAKVLSKAMVSDGVQVDFNNLSEIAEGFDKITQGMLSTIGMTDKQLGDYVDEIGKKGQNELTQMFGEEVAKLPGVKERKQFISETLSRALAADERLVNLKVKAPDITTPAEPTQTVGDGTVGKYGEKPNPEEGRPSVETQARDAKTAKAIETKKENSKAEIGEHFAKVNAAADDAATMVEIPQEGTISLTNNNLDKFRDKLLAQVEASLEILSDNEKFKNLDETRKKQRAHEINYLKKVKKLLYEGTDQQVLDCMRESKTMFGEFSGMGAYNDVRQSAANDQNNTNSHVTTKRIYGLNSNDSPSATGSRTDSANPSKEIVNPRDLGEKPERNEGRDNANGEVDDTISQSATLAPGTSGINQEEHTRIYPTVLSKEDQDAVRNAEAKPEGTLAKEREAAKREKEAENKAMGVVNGTYTRPEIIPVSTKDLTNVDKVKQMLADVSKDVKMANKAMKKSIGADRVGWLNGYLAKSGHVIEDLQALRDALKKGKPSEISLAIDYLNSDTDGMVYTFANGIGNKNGVLLSDILNDNKEILNKYKNRASVDSQNNGSPFEVTKESVGNLFGKGSRVTDNGDGSFTVDTKSGKITITSSGEINVSDSVLRSTWGNDVADRVASGESVTVGKFSIGENGVPLIELAKADASNFTANHELFHAAVNMAMSSKQWDVLRKKFVGNNADNASAEEIIADKFASWRDGRLKQTGIIASIFRKVSDFFSGIKSMFTGENYQDVFRKIESGKIWEQDEGVDTGQTERGRVSNDEKDVERVVTDYEADKSRMNELFDKNGGSGWFQRTMDKVVPALFNDKRMVRRIFGAETFKTLEKELATDTGKAANKIINGDKARGTKGFVEILSDIPASKKDSFEEFAAWHNLRDIAGSRTAIQSQIANLVNLAKDESRNAKILRRDVASTPRGVFESSEIRDYLKAADGSVKMSRAYMQEAKELNKVLKSKQTIKTYDFYTDEIRKVSAQNPTWEGKVRELVKIGRAQLQDMVDVGIVSEETKNKVLQAHPNYIPLARNLDGGFESLDSFAQKYSNGVLDVANPLKRYIGGNDYTLKSPVEQLMANQYRVENLRGRMNVLNTIKDGVESGAYGDIIQKAKPGQEPSAKQGVLSMYEGGKKVDYIMDKDIAMLLDEFNARPESLSFVDKAMRIPGAVLRGGVTVSPSFAIPNMIRDSFGSAILNPGFIPIVDSVKGLMSVLKQDSNYQDFLEHGGSQEMNWRSTEKRRQEAKNLYKDDSKKTPLDMVKKGYNFFEHISELSEAATRVGTYNRLVEMGVPKDEAAFRTIDQMWFGRGGTTSKRLNKTIPFFNAAMQGTYSFAKKFSDQNGNIKMDKGTLLRGLLYLSLPSLMFAGWNYGDDERKRIYTNIPQQQKNQYWNLVLGGGSDSILKIPKPHLPGILFGSIPERFADYLALNDKRAFDGMIGTVYDAVGPDMMPSFFRLPFEIANNKSFFYQRDIVPASETRYAPRDQAGPYTSDTARFLANVVYNGTSPLMNALGKEGLEFSPRKLQYIVEQVTGNAGRELLKGSDAIARMSEGKELPTRNILEDLPVTNRFVSNADKMRREENDFRTELDSALGVVNSAELSAPEGLSTHERKLLRVKDKIKDMQSGELRAIVALQKEIKDITNNNRMSGDRKRQLIDARDKKIAAISRSGLKKLDKVMENVY